MHRTLCLLLLHFGLYVQCYILHPSYRSNQSPVDLNIQTLEPLQSHDWSSLDEKKEYVRGLSENRVERHVDAIFTNTYRKFLGQISARRYLQNMIGKTLGQDTQKKADPDDGRLLGEELFTLLNDSLLVTVSNADGLLLHKYGSRLIQEHGATAGFQIGGQKRTMVPGYK